jgi:hypothetical protein
MKKEDTLLLVDAIINLALGIPLAFFPRGAAEFLGIPIPNIPFYASILGAVLMGIGLALLIERSTHSRGMTGLGIGGAIAINLCGAGALSAWLIGGELDLPLRGTLFLGFVAALVFVAALFEILSFRRQMR